MDFMKNLYFFCLILLISLISVFSVSALCINTADNYAVEVLLNKPDISYDLNVFDNAQNVIIKEHQYILKSNYNPHLALILEKVSSPLQGLSIRLQIPVKSEEENLPYLKISSTGATGIINLTGEDNFNGWKISCVSGSPPAQCEFDKGKTSILSSMISPNKYEVVIETREELGDCISCDGRCLILPGGSKCINRNLRDDIGSVLKYSGLVSSVEEVFLSYKLISSGNAIIIDLSPESSTDIDWQEAIKQELRNLNRNSVISITEQDIEEISKLSKKGSAGQNLRIVYGEDKDGEQSWLYYYETKFPILTSLKNCNEFPSSLVPTGMLIFSSSEISTYYLIPLILTLTLIFLLVILIFIARMINLQKRKKKIKPITGLQSASA